jgi:AcrR family transcriptional regulator
LSYRRTDRVAARLADNRTRIVEAAREQVSRGGWANTQITSVAAAAGLATGTVYRHFASKTELFAEVLANVSVREIEVLDAIATTAKSPIDGLHAAVRAFVKRAMANPRLAYALIAEPCEREIDAARLTYRAAISQQILKLVRAGQRDGSFAVFLRGDVAASVIVGGFMEALIGPLSPLTQQSGGRMAHDPMAIESLANEIADLCCACIAVPRPALSVPLAPPARKLA